MYKIIILALFGCCALVTAQTFQYSRGWTNGKRSGASDTLPLKQMMPNPMQVLTANDLNSRERLIHQIIKNPCDLRLALLTHNFKMSDDFSPPTADGIDDDAINRFKREMINN